MRGTHIDLDFHEVGVDPKHRGAERFEEHPKAEGLAQSEAQSVTQNGTSRYRYSSYRRSLQAYVLLPLLSTTRPAASRWLSLRAAGRSFAGQGDHRSE